MRKHYHFCRFFNVNDNSRVERSWLHFYKATNNNNHSWCSMLFCREVQKRVILKTFFFTYLNAVIIITFNSNGKVNRKNI